MKKVGLIAGCSHSAGSEIDGTSDSDYNRSHSFGSLLCDKLGYEPINISLSGSANSGIARSIVRWLDQFYKADEMEVFACIGWTESSRLEIPSMCDYRQSNLAVPWFDDSANSFWRINFGLESKNQDEQEIFATYQRFMAENPLILENWSASNVLMIQYLLNSLKINYVMCSTMHMFQPNEHFTSYLVNTIDETHYYNLKTTQDKSFYHYYADQGYTNPKAKYWHHNEEPHRLYAEELHNFIKDSVNV